MPRSGLLDSQCILRGGSFVTQWLRKKTRLYTRRNQVQPWESSESQSSNQESAGTPSGPPPGQQISSTKTCSLGSLPHSSIPIPVPEHRPHTTAELAHNTNLASHSTGASQNRGAERFMHGGLGFGFSVDHEASWSSFRGSSGVSRSSGSSRNSGAERFMHGGVGMVVSVDHEDSWSSMGDPSGDSRS